MLTAELKCKLASIESLKADVSVLALRKSN